MYGYNAGPLVAIAIYTVLPYCVISQTQNSALPAADAVSDNLYTYINIFV